MLIKKRRKKKELSNSQPGQIVKNKNHVQEKTPRM
jgi:hypothetical protein